MVQIFGIFALLVGASMLSGYLPVRMLAASWPGTSRLALQPLLGAGLITLTLGWVHYFAPLGEQRVLIGFVPVAAGAAAFANDWRKGKLKRRFRGIFVWAALCIGA